MTTRAFVVAALLGLAAQGPGRADSAARAVITAPVAGSYVTGRVLLRASLEPAAAAASVRRVLFFADGREVCRLVAPPFECEWDAGRDVVARVVRVVFHFADGGRAAATVRTAGLEYADRVEVDAVQLAVVVTDPDGRFVSGLPRAAFRVFEDDVPQRIGSFLAEDVPLELVAALDVSLSMTDAMPDLKRAARSFLATLPPAAEVSLLAFNDNVFTVARRAAAPEARQRAVDRLAPWGGTALYDVIIRSLEQLDRQTGRRALVLFSDGEDQSSRSTERDAVARVEASDAMIYTVGLGRATTVRPYRRLLERLASVSGGRGLFPDRSDELQDAFTTIVEDLSHQYLIGYQPAKQVRDGAWRRVRVEVRGGAYTVRHRQGYRLLAAGG